MIGRRPRMNHLPITGYIELSEAVLSNPASVTREAHRLRLGCGEILLLVVEEKRPCATLDKIEIVHIVKLIFERGNLQILAHAKLTVQHDQGAVARI